MSNVYFDLIDEIKFLISVGYNKNEISSILNLDENYIIYLLKKIRSDVIKKCDCEEFYLVLLIDKILNKKLNNINKFAYPQQYEILKLFNLSDEEIMRKLNINVQMYINFLKSMYFALYVYDIHGVDKSFLSIIKDRLDNINYIEEVKKHNISVKEYNDKCNVELFDKNSISIDIECGKICNLGDNDIKFIVISDTHFGAFYERLDYLEKVYDYAIKNGIKYIVLTGDLIEGNVFSYDRCKIRYKDIESQVEHVLRDYCYDKNIKNIILLGNHDFSSYYRGLFDISSCLTSRDDFHILGYKEGYLKIKDEYITLKHEVSKILTSFGNPNTLLSFIGHSHQYRCNYDSDIRFKVPAMCDAPVRNNYCVNRGFLVCELNFDSLGLTNIETDFIRFDMDDNIKFQKTFRK